MIGIAILLFFVLLIIGFVGYYYYKNHIRNFCYQEEGKNCKVLTSPNGLYQAGLFPDGFKVKYLGQTKCAITSSNDTSGQILAMQPDGNLVVYDPSGNPIWNSGTSGKGTPPYKYVIGDDGNTDVVDANGSSLFTTQHYCK